MTLTSKKYLRPLLLLAGGVLTGLCVVCPTVGFLEWLTLVPVGIFLLEYASDTSVRLRRLYAWGLFFFMCYYLVVFHWFINLYPLDFIDGMTPAAALAVVLFAHVGLSFFQSLFGGLVFVALAVLFRSRADKRLPFIKPFAAGAVWAVYEWTQTLGWWGVPWGRLPLGQSKLLVGLQTASLFGSYFITFLLVAVNFCAAYAVCACISGDRRVRMSAIKLSSLSVALMLAFNYGAGAALWFGNDRDAERTVRVAVVQGNISSNEKWSTLSAARTRKVYREYTLKAASEGAQIVVWPETALPYTVVEGNGTYTYLSELAKEANVTILAGAFSPAEGKKSDYNAILCFTPDGQMSDTVYAKRHLVPFGEFVPMRELFELIVPPLTELVMTGEDIEQGKDAEVFELDEGSLGSLICFDSIYEELALDSVRDGAQILCISSNDSWFTDSVALYMHNAQAQLRAIETDRYIARSANTGISSFISDRGEIISSTQALVDGMLIEDVPLSDTRTLYTRIGNLFVYLCIGAYALVIAPDAVIYVRKKRQKNCDKNVNNVKAS